MQNQKVIISKNNRLIVKRCILVISLLLIICGIVLFSNNISNNNHISKVDSESLKAFFSHNNINAEMKTTEDNSKKEIINYMAVIEIPSINLIHGIPYPGKDNTVDRNIQIINPISLPDMVNGNFILASHSGSSSISYFKKLNKIKENDKVYIYYDNVKYIYKVNNQYLVDKGHVSIRRDHSQSTLTLITCDKKDDTKQLVVIAYLQNTEKY